MNDRQIRSSLRSEFNTVGWILLLYYGIMNLSVTAVSLIQSLFMILTNLGSMDDPFNDAVLDSIANGLVSNGWGYIIAAFICCGILILWKKKDFVFGEFLHRGKPMGIGSALQLLCLTISAQALVQIMTMAMEWFFGLFDISVVDSLESSMITGDTLSMFLYMGVVAPVFEEILFRGVVLKILRPYGKKFAIIASAFLFGVFHGNVIQTPFAFLVGLILAYVTLEYSIGWAMVLHMFNNMILGDSLTRISELFQPWVGELVFAVIIWGCFIGSLFILWRKRRQIRAYCTDDQTHPQCLEAFVTSPGILVLSGLMIASLLLSLVMIFISQL